MKQLIALAALALFLVPTAYGVSEARDPRVPAMQRQIAGLTARVNAQGSLVDQHANVINRNADIAACWHAQDADVSQAIIEYLLNQDLPRYDDGGACSRVGVARPVVRLR